MSDWIRFILDDTDKLPDLDGRIQGLLGSKITRFGDLFLPTGCHEAKRCAALQSLLKEYQSRKEVSRPLSIAVFGPPGSGKSRNVKELLKSVEGYGKIKTINLSQIQDKNQLSLAFADAMGFIGDSTDSQGDDDNLIKAIFFDEFDSSLNGSSLAWLQWFLSPMQDGAVVIDSKSQKFGKVVFFFAGGTAETFEAFEARAKLNPAEYREKKVPDFISRLRGTLDIEGVNTHEQREMRRALVFYYMFSKQFPDLCTENGALNIEKQLLESLLSTAHFEHGARSMEAVLEMSCLYGSQKLGLANLPAAELLELHVNRGPLDGKTVGISAGSMEEDTQELLVALSEALLKQGATIAYGGDFKKKGTLDSLVRAAKRLPKDLVKRKDSKRIINYSGFPSYKNPRTKVPPSSRQIVEVRELKTLSSTEMDELGLRDAWFHARPDLHHPDAYRPKLHLAWAISLFRMRLRLIQDVDALIVLGGKRGESWGRFSGIAEEVMLAVELGKPVYILGAKGAAAEEVGNLMGLGETLVNPETCLQESSPIESAAGLISSGSCFKVPGRSALPTTIAELRTYLFERGIVTPFWNWNGLDVKGNRLLFKSKISNADTKDCVELITRGLSRLHWNDGTNVG